ncbi:MAG: hypothetical protein QCI38_02335 [Candidatus Thermoplasmatota archaeon]|nr:hypothetical protein [Candidatus Thermoplasmatota archaeon]
MSTILSDNSSDKRDGKLMPWHTEIENIESQADESEKDMLEEEKIVSWTF